MKWVEVFLLLVATGVGIGTGDPLKMCAVLTIGYVTMALLKLLTSGD